MQILMINTHLTYPGWSEGKLNATFMDIAKAFFTERGHQVAETFVERGYEAEEEVKKHMAADLVLLQTLVNWFSAPWIYEKYVDEVFNVGLMTKALLEGDGRTRHDPIRQYGTGGKMHGRKFMISATWNAPRETFDNPNSILFGGKEERGPIPSHHVQLQVLRLRYSPGFWRVRHLQGPGHPARN